METTDDAAMSRPPRTGNQNANADALVPFTVRKMEGRGDPPGRSVGRGRGGSGAAGCRVHLQMPVDADVVRSNLVAEALDGGGEPLFDGGKIILGGDTSHAAEQQHQQRHHTDGKGGVSVPTPVLQGTAS